MPDKTAIVMPWQKEAEPISVTKKNRTPECTKPLASFETRGFVYIEFGGEGEIRILETPTKRIQEVLMVQFMIWAGPRVSGTIALAWEDVNLKQGTVTFQRSKVRGAYRVTKTRRSTRKVRLLAPAWDTLRRIDAINQVKKAETVEIVERDNKTVRKHTLRFVFLNSKSGLPHVSDFVVRDRFFKTHLLAVGVRYRGLGQYRHTYASQLLTTGVASIDWIAEQMGHTNGNMIRQHYGTWINEDGPDVVGMLQLALKL